VFCADIGSIKNGKFAWARRIPAEAGAELHNAASIESLADAVAVELNQERPVALGFEMPLFIPVPEAPDELGKARPCDAGAPAWCSPPGAAVLATGLPQVAWLLSRLHELAPEANLHLTWPAFNKAQQGLLIWEAFVSGKAKGETDEADAVIGINTFVAQMPTGNLNAAETQRPFSLAAAAALWAGWAVPPQALRRPCILARA
jgi:hypothetical protein